jgi:hypothetical protein
MLTTSGYSDQFVGTPKSIVGFTNLWHGIARTTASIIKVADSCLKIDLNRQQQIYATTLLSILSIVK